MKKYLVIAVLAVFGALFAVPGVASAHHVTLTADVSCLEDDGSWSVTWTANNSESNKTMDITDTDLVGDSNTSGGFDQNPADPTFSPDPVPFSGNATAVTEHGSGTARVRLSVTGDWTQASENTDTETVNKPTQLCNPHVHGTASLDADVSCV
ncbi:MAG TPA: hypothetical protein VG845_01320, partial [Dehalococcoidia bacterium]|nr:hypothetical protein [Dehalococcoidia bacterium]